MFAKAVIINREQLPLISILGKNLKYIDAIRLGKLISTQELPQM